VSPRTKAIVVINPNNPTGALYPVDLLQGIVEIARQHQLIVFADEIYDKTLYDGAHAHEHRLAGRRRALRHLQRPVEELPRLRLPRRLDGGLGRQAPRAGLHRGPEHARLDAPVRQHAGPAGHPDGAGRLPEHQGPRGPGRAAAPSARPRLRAAVADPGRERASSRRRRCTCSRAWTRRSTASRTTRHFAYELLAEEKVLIVQGTGFNWPDPDHFRIVFLPNSDDLTEAIGRIGRFLAHYRRRHPA
jgi:alanine-synthesizing transaminase